MKGLKAAIEGRDATQAELDALLNDKDGKPLESLTDEQEKRSQELLGELDKYDEQIRDEHRAAKRQARVAEARQFVASAETRTDDGSGEDAKVTAEPTVYGEGSPHSFYADMSRVAAGAAWGPLDPAVIERQREWSHQVERHIALDDKFGRQAVTEIRGMQGIRSENGTHARNIVEECRGRGRVALDNKEFRTGITSGSGATASASGGGGAAFVTPVFYVDDYAPYREAGRAFADVCNKQPLPDYGMNVYMPQVTAKAGVASQTEGQGVNESDPTFAYLSAGLVTEAGQVIVTQQLLDRAGPNFAFDRLIFDQLQRDLAPTVDAYVLTQALSGAGTVAFTGTWAFAAQPGTVSFVSKFAGAINTIETTNGTIMSPTCAFVQPSRWNYIESVGALESSSGTLHPLVVPSANGPFNAFASQQGSGQTPYEGDTGFKILGLPVFKDLNIPSPTSGADQCVVANTNEVYVYEGPQVPRTIPQTYANNLQILLQLYEYLAVLVRYPSAVQKVTGTAMSSITF